MKKATTIFVLLAFIVLCFTFIILRLGARGSEDNFFNTTLRLKLAKTSIIRHVLGLHFDGDARSDYLSQRYTEIVIEVDQMQGLNIPTTALDLLQDKISTATGKKVSYFLSDKNISYQEDVNSNQVDQIARKYRNFQSDSNRVGLYLLYLSGAKDHPEQMGSSYNETSILLFATTLNAFVGSNPQVFNNFVESTALHEFGHQLGLGHNDHVDCLMQAYVDEGVDRNTRPASIIVDFCTYEKLLIKRNAQV